MGWVEPVAGSGEEGAEGLRIARSSQSCFFFFQAEDGIRDKLVTGVQTCALPIYFGIRSDRDELIALDGKRFSNGRAGVDSDDLAVIENLVGDEGRSLLSKQPAGYNACDQHQNEGNSCSSKVHVVIYSNKGGFATSS